MNVTLAQCLAVAVGGAGGALCRYGLSSAFAIIYPSRFTLATFIANVLGSFLIGITYVLIVERELLAPLYRQLLMVGFLGAFTTFSTFSLESLGLLQKGQVVAAVSYMFASVLLCLLAVAAGFSLARLFSN